MNLDSIDNKYLEMSDGDIDKLLMGLDLDTEDKEEEDTKNLCSSCSSEDLVINPNGECICQSCGVVNSEMYDEMPEFNNDLEGTSRYGCPSNYFYPKSALGTKFRTKGYSRISNIQRQGQMPYREKSLLETLTKIQKKCKNYGITQAIVDNSKILYKKVSDCKHTKGKRAGKNRIMRCINLRSMIAACVFYACKLQGEPRSPKEIADIWELEIKHVNKGCRRFLEFIDLESLNTEFTSSKSSDFIERFAGKLNLEKQYIKIAQDISKNIHKLDIASTHEPPSVAAGCILLVSIMYHLDISKKQISDVFKISDVTISKTYRRIHPFHKIVMSNTITDLVLEKRNNIPKKKLEINEENLVVSDEEKQAKLAKKKSRAKSKTKAKTKSSKKLLTESEDSSDDSDIEV
jgi:transcription initiation factor TFIIIB Brf1 subunit/transcription initiation factor TFIIB